MGQHQNDQLHIKLKPGKHVLAVSGGVDSVVLLDLLADRYTSSDTHEFIVAHFDHGIRPDSRDDAEFVKNLAQGYGMPYESDQGKLGNRASEAEARKARYVFLYSVKEKHEADAIVTAHHQDDVIETAIINLLRGTYRKGLSSLKSGRDIQRPLLNVSKATINRYATRRNIQWREDASNTDTRYLRNYVRHELIPAMRRLDGDWRERILQHIDTAEELNEDINDTLDFVAIEQLEATSEGVRFNRHWLIMLPGIVGREVLHYAFQRVGLGQISSQQLKKAFIFCKTAKPGKRMELAGGHEIVIDGKQVLLTNN